MAKQKILIVDDEDGIREMLRFDLEEAHYGVEEAIDGLDALEKVAQEDFDFVITDVRMPRLDGIELLDKLQSINKAKLKIVLMTAYSGISHEEAFRRGASAVLGKPFDMEQLISILRALGNTEKSDQFRKSPRLPVKLQGKISFSPIGETKVVFENFSKSGFFVGTNDPIPSPDTMIEFEVKLTHPSSTIISGKGIVKWVRIGSLPQFKPGFGVQFTDWSDNGFRLLSEYLHKKDPERYSPAE